jgi:hypothetical protein
MITNLSSEIKQKSVPLLLSFDTITDTYFIKLYMANLAFTRTPMNNIKSTVIFSLPVSPD